MRDILVINTGGTFNKQYNRFNGNNEVESNNDTLNEIFKRWMCEFNVLNIIGKDSLEFTDDDRELLKETINNAKEQNIIVVHGTDTIDLSANYIDNYQLSKNVVFTGTMVPFNFNPIEATANFASAIGYIQALDCTCSISICMNGVCGNYEEVFKDRELGLFKAKSL